MLRPAYPDELGRAQSLLNGHPVPAHATWLLYLKETPVERIIAAIPSWKTPGKTQDDPETLRFYPSSLDRIDPDTLLSILSALEETAYEQDLASLTLDFALPGEHPLFKELLSQGYQVSQTDRHFTVPGDIVKSRSLRIYRRIKAKIPSDWEIKSIFGQDPGKLYAFVSAHGLMSPQAFKNYWNTANREHFEAAYSYVILDADEIIGIFLVTQRGPKELHIHVEAANPESVIPTSLISTTLRNASFSHCPEGFPEIFTWRADSEKHRQTGNTALRQGGTEEAPRHFLTKTFSPC